MEKLNGHTKDASGLTKDRHTEDIQEIITKVPSWILRWGITIFLAVLLMAVGISVMIKYPDTVKGNLKIESSIISKPGISSVNGIISKVIVAQGAIVKIGQPVIYIAVPNNASPVILAAAEDGKVAYLAIAQPGSILKAGQQVFSIHPEHEEFYGVMEVPINVIGKLKVGQTALINVNENSKYSKDKIQGKITYIADEPFKQGFFLLKITFLNINENVHLKSWMSADVEIVTQDATVFSRISKNILKSMF